MAGNSCTTDRSLALEAGRRLASAEPGEEVVITGISGFYPDSDNVTDFAEKLFNKVDLISDDDRRWKLGNTTVTFVLVERHKGFNSAMCFLYPDLRSIF